MKINFFKSFLLALCLSMLIQCAKQENPEPSLKDHSLIIAEASPSEYVIVSPSNGELRAQVQPDVQSIDQLALGYQCQKAIVTGKEPGGKGIKVIYTCDRETGDNLFQVTSEADWDVMFVDVAQTGPQIVFSAQNVKLLSDDNIHRINEDGSGYKRLSTTDEVVDCFGVSCKIWAAYDPAWSPEASKIAFDIHLREVADQHPHNGICIMNSSGTDKQILFDVNVEETHIKDICFTQDGQFIVFLHGLGNETKVKVLHINSLKLKDVTSQFLVEGMHPTNIWTSPDEDKIIFNKYEPGGGDLYEIKYTIVNTDDFQIVGPYKVLAAYQEHKIHFGVPDWQLWNGN